ncbi:MAG: hypothetical protein IKY31_08940 [Bacteroidaceae bacterium]|nr:hypothetical protein [Bacteroidaceae bacterium]
MKTSKKQFWTALCGTIVATIPIAAQRQVIIANEAPNSIVMVSSDNAGNELIEVMNTSQLPHVHDPQIPRFILTDREGNFALGIGGYVRTVASYDFDGLVNNIDFIPAAIPNHSPFGNQIQMDATTANIFLKLVGTSPILGDFIVHTEGNFRGNGNTFKLRNAYLSFSGLTLGYTYGGFMDAAAMPATIDFQGPNGGAFYRATQIAYLCDAVDNFRFNLSVEMPQVNGSTNNIFQIGRQRMPDFTAFAQYNWENNSHIRLGGLIRSMTYTFTESQKTNDALGYGVQASTTFAAGPVRMFGQLTYGKGIGQYLNDLGDLNVDLVIDPQNAEKMQVLPMMGWYAGAQYNISPNLFVSGTYSMARLYSENDYQETAPTDYHYGQYLAGNVFWNASNELQFGVEYLHGWRTNFDQSDKQANRINLMAKYSF